jgi:hypothetical protein
MTDVVICNPLRTPVGRMGGALAALTAAELATAALRELVTRTGLGEGDVDDVILGNGYASGEAPAIGRIADFRSIDAAVPACRPCSTRPARSPPVPPASSWPAGPSRCPMSSITRSAFARACVKAV